MPAQNIETRFLDKTEYPLWNDFVLKSPQGTFFQNTFWLETLGQCFDRRLRIVICLRNDKIVGGFNFFENKKIYANLITSVFLAPFNGPVFSEDLETKIQKTIANQIEYLQNILDFLDKKYKIITINTHQRFNDLRVFNWNDYQIIPEHTYICNLDNETKLLNNFNQSLRKKLQKCEELDYEFEESKDYLDFVELFDKSYKKHGKRPPISLADLEYVIKKILEFPETKLFFALTNTKKTAARIIINDTTCIYDLLAGSDDESGLASSFLVTQIMKKYIGMDKVFDFMGADHQKIEQFKRAFGGKIVQRFKLQNRPGFILNMALKLNQSIVNVKRNI